MGNSERRWSGVFKEDKKRLGHASEKVGVMKVVDTDIFVDFFSGVSQAASFLQNNADDIFFAAITKAELLAGRVCNDPLERERVFHVLSQFEKIPIYNPLVQVVGDFRRKYGIEIPDAIVAACAFVIGGTLITRNVQDFEKIKEIRVEKPY